MLRPPRREGSGQDRSEGASRRRATERGLGSAGRDFSLLNFSFLNLLENFLTSFFVFPIMEV